MSSPYHVTEPTIVFLHRFLNDVEVGFIRVPKFQRPIVWNNEQRLELFRTISKGMPIGSILLVRTSDIELQSSDSIGPVPIEAKKKRALTSFILDGHQRISTLFGCMKRHDDAHEDVSGNRFDVHYDLERANFVFPNRSHNEIPKTYLPLNIIFDSKRLLKFQRNLADGNRSEELLDRSDELVDILRNFKLPVIPIYTDDLEYATDAFRRINYEGTKMSDVDMIAALSWAQDFDLHDRLEEVKEERLSVKGWGALHEKWILAACKAHLGLDMYRSNAKDVGMKIKDEREFLEAVIDDVVGAADFLAEECGVKGPKILPYGYQLVALAEAMGAVDSLGNGERRSLRRWFWLSTYAGTFAGASGTDLTNIFELTRKIAKSEVDDLDEFFDFEDIGELEKDFLFTRVRSRAIALRIAAFQEEYGAVPDALNVLARFGNEAIHHIFLKREVSPESYASPANLFVADPERSVEVRERIVGERKIGKSELKGFLVSDEVRAALDAGKPDDFISVRAEALEEIEQRFVAEVREQ